MIPDFAAARGVAGSVLATLLAACGAGGASPVPNNPRSSPVSIVGQCAPQLASQFVTVVRIADSTRGQPPDTVRLAAGRFPLLATEARPADVDAGGGNEIGIEERKVATVAVAAITDALQRGLVGGPRYGVGLHGGSFAVAWGPQLTLTLFNCAYTADVWVSGLVTWAHADIFGSGGFLPAYRPLTADLVVSGPGTVGGTLHVAGSWLSNDPDGHFSVTGALGGKQVAVLVPEYWVAPVASPEGSQRCFRAQTAASVILEELVDGLSCTPRGPARQPYQPLFTPRWCFTYQGEPMRAVGSAWERSLRRAGIEAFRFHDLRHTWASWHVMSGTSLQELMELGGWKSFEMVLRYAHLAPEHLSSAAKHIERGWGVVEANPTTFALTWVRA